MQRSPISIAGVDGCRGGWVVAHDGGIEVIGALATLAERFDVIGIDMPIGLPHGLERSADTEARRFLGHRRSTIFTVPTRALLDAPDHAEANARSRRLHGRGLSIQSYNLFPKIREVDALPVTWLRERFVEIHPECAFARMAGAPLPPKRTAHGRSERVDLVHRHVGLDVTSVSVRGADRHDVLDACAVLWSARRHVQGRSVAFGDGSLDERGLPMRIVS